MKSVILPMLALLFTLTGFTQLQNPYPRTITVNGSAEMDITPDEIYVNVDLKEYEKKGQGKIGIEKIRQDFLAAVRSLGLPDTAVTIFAYDGNYGNPLWRKKNKLKDELYASITYQVKLKNSAQVDQLVDKLDDEATQNFYVQRTSHSKLEEFRKQLKIGAIKAAREKAIYLAAALDQSIGVPVTINEPHEFYQPYFNTMSNVRMKAEAADMDQPQADFKKMKLKFDVTVVFELK